MNKEEIILASQQYLFPAVFHYYDQPLVIERAKDQFVYDADGNRYLDFFAGILTISVGHCNEAVNREVHRQVDTLQHVSTVFATAPQAALAAKIATLTPQRKLTKSFFTNSGTEANETAIMAARYYTGSTEIIALRHSYHGRSSLAMSITGHAAWRLPGAVQPGVVHAHNAYCYRCPFGLTYPDCGVKCATDVEELIRTTTSGRVAGLIAEPIQGVGGFITPPPEYFPIIAGIVRKHGGIIISDEVQTAWGRTGKGWFAMEHFGVVPDVITSAKGLGNGMPIGLTVASSEVADSVKGLTISTFGGNPVATTAARAVIEFIESNRLTTNAAEAGAYLRDGLEELQRKHDCIGDVRGMGLMQAMELVKDRASKEPDTERTIRVLDAARQNRILIGRGGLYGNVIRISPPLNIGKTDVDEFIRALDTSLSQTGPAGV
jgi:4-aminobutyrate aminotransferase-like enzyme